MDVCIDNIQQSTAPNQDQSDNSYKH